MRPEPPLRVISKPGPGPVVAGSEALLTIELLAPNEPGDFVGEVVIKTEVNVFTLTVSARIVPAGHGAGGVPGGSARLSSPPKEPEIVLDENKTLEETLGHQQEQPPLA